jgi:hypothetical protein
VSSDDVKLWFDSNNICYLKLELFHDFLKSLVGLVYKTYMGHDDGLKINIGIEDNINHFNWCWMETIKNFKNEEIHFEPEGEHYEFIKGFIEETFYNQTISEVKTSLIRFFEEIFNMSTTLTMSDLDLLTTIYKNFDKNLINNLQNNQ